MSMFTAGPSGVNPARRSTAQSVKQENKKLYSETIDPDAARRQAVTKMSNAMMSLQMLKDLGAIDEKCEEIFIEAYELLTKARFLLVEHVDPDNVLDELSQL
jgi:hypothetical protein